MILVRMKKSVETVGMSYRINEVYELKNRLATEFMTLGWATALSESTAISPAKRQAITQRVSKR